MSWWSSTSSVVVVVVAAAVVVVVFAGVAVVAVVSVVAAAAADAAFCGFTSFAFEGCRLGPPSHDDTLSPSAQGNDPKFPKPTLHKRLRLQPVKGAHVFCL